MIKPPPPQFLPLNRDPATAIERAILVLNEIIKKRPDVSQDFDCESFIYYELNPALEALRKGTLPEERSAWIPCSERMPEERLIVVTVCMAADGARLRMVGHRNPHMGWILGCSEEVKVTHWMPLPPLPEVSEPQHGK